MNRKNIRLEIIKAFDECHMLFKHAEETYILKKMIKQSSDYMMTLR